MEKSCMNNSTTTIRISRATHDKLRLKSYQTNRRITDIIDELVKDFEGPSISDKVNQLLNEVK